MAKIVLTQWMSHSPFLFSTPEQWEEIRSRRPLNPNVPVDTAEVNTEKHQRCMTAFAKLRERFAEARPDVVVIFGDDQLEQFTFSNFPAFGVFVGEEFEGYKQMVTKVFMPGAPREMRPKTPEEWTRVKSDPRLAKEILVGLIERDFDVAMNYDHSDQERGMGHAFMRPLYHVAPDYDVAVVPFWINCYYGPQPTARRCYNLGKALREVIEAYPSDLRVAVIGSGGLWHTPGQQDAILDEAFDQGIIERVAQGDGPGAVAFFDGYGPAKRVVMDDVRKVGGGTGIEFGVGSGSGETRNWIAAMGVSAGASAEIIDYVPVYASPCGMGFATTQVLA